MVLLLAPLAFERLTELPLRVLARTLGLRFGGGHADPVGLRFGGCHADLPGLLRPRMAVDLRLRVTASHAERSFGQRVRVATDRRPLRARLADHSGTESAAARSAAACSGAGRQYWQGR